MTRHVTVVLLTVLLLLPAVAEELTAADIIARLDANMTAGTMSYEAELTINLAGQVRTKSFRGYTEGSERSYLEFTAPVRDRNTRFLKLGDEMWMWLPRVGKSTKLAGHMLRQSLMGSDFSYSDAARNDRLLDDYDAGLLGTDSLDGNPVYVLDLVARSREPDYARQKMWVDVTSFAPLRIEYYAGSGKLLKELRVEEVRRIGGRNYPTRIRLVNRLRRDTWTVMEFTRLELDAAIPGEVFTRSYLER